MTPEERRKLLEANRRANALRMQNSPSAPQPKQSFFNKVRDVFDANTEADKYRRQQANRPTWYADEQKQAGSQYISNNIGSQFINTLRSSPENIGRAYGEISGQSNRAREAVARTEEENLRQLQEAAKRITSPGTSLAERARLRTQMRKVGRLQNESFAESQKNRAIFNKNTAPGKVAASVADVGLNLVGLGVAGVAGKELGTTVAKQGFRVAAKEAAPAFFQNLGLNTIQGATGELNEGKPTLKGALKKAAIGGVIGTGADLLLAGIPAIRSNKAYKSIVQDLADTSDQQVVKETLRSVSKDLPEDTLDTVSKDIAKTADPVEVDNILKQAADAETNVAKNVASNSTDVVDKDLVKAFKEAKTPEQTKQAVRTLFPDLDEPTLIQTAKALADAKDDKTIASIIETMQIRRKAVSEGVQTATPQGEAVTPTPEQQLAEAPQATAPIASNQAPDQNIVANQPTGQVAPSSTAAPDPNIEANQVISPTDTPTPTNGVADAVEGRGVTQTPEVSVPQNVTNSSSINGEFQKAMVDRDAAYINYLKKVEKETGQTGLVDQFYYDSGLQRRSNSIANAQTSNSQSLSEAFGGLTGDAKKEFDDYVSLRNEIANAKNGLVTKEKLPALQAKEAALRGNNEARFQALNSYYKEWAQRLKDAGIIDEPTFQSFVKNDDYTRIQRVMDDLQGFSNGTGNSMSLGQSKSWFKRKGSLRETQPADITALNYAQQIQGEIQRNQTASNMIDVLVEQGHAKKLPSGKTANKNTIGRIVDGKTEIYQVPKDIKEVADNITPFQLGALGKVVSAPQRVLRAGATGLSVPFTAANYVKDQAGVAVLSKDLAATSLIPKNAAEGLYRAAQDTLGGDINDPVWRKFIEVGGDTTGYDFIRNAKSAAKASREVRLGTKGKYANMAGAPIRTLEDLNSITERATRFQSFKGIYDKVLEQTGNEAEAMRQATLASWQNSVDFSRMGNVAQAINLVIPYFNAGIQGTRLLGRRFAEAPLATSMKTVGIIGLPLAGVTLYNLSDPERRKVYENISDYEKQNNIIIVLPGAKQGPDGSYDNVIKIPLQRGLSNVAQPFRMQAENFAKVSDQNEIAQMAQQFFGAFSGPIETGSLRGFGGSLTPQVAKPVVQQVFNQDLYTGKPIVPDYINEATDAQGNPVAEKDKAYKFTSGTARAIGGKLGISPLRVEKFIRDTTAKTGLYALNAVDNALAKAGAIPQEQIGGISAKDDIIKRFFKAQGEYNYEKSAGGKYFDSVKAATANLNANEKAAYNTLHPSKTNFLGDEIFDENKRLTKYARAGIYLQFPKVFAADKALNDSQAKQGNPSNPLFGLPKDQLTKVLLKATLPPGSKDPELSNLYEKDWYQDYNIKRTKYYQAIKSKLAKEGKKMPKSDNPYPDTPKDLQKTMDYYSSLPKGTGARSGWIKANPTLFTAMKNQWGAVDAWENKERVALGLNPIDNTDTSSGNSSGSGKGKFGYGSKGSSKKEKEQRLYLSQLLGNVPTVTSSQAQIKRTPTRTKLKVKLPSGKGRNYKKIKLN